MLSRIVKSGFDQGCFIRPTDGQLLDVTTQAEILDVHSERGGQRYDVEDPYGLNPIDMAPVDGTDPGYVIISQRCDLVKCLRDEPFVELARATYITDRALISQAKKNSPQIIFLAEDGNGAWVFDLRRRALLPKHCLDDFEVVLPVAKGRDRKDLAQRIGRRYSRNAVPDDIVVGFQAPLAKWVEGSRERIKQSGIFAELLVWRDEESEGSLVFVAIIDGPEADEAIAQPIFESWIHSIKEKVDFPISPRSSVLSADSIPLGLWKDAYKLDLTSNSRGPKASEDAALPFE